MKTVKTRDLPDSLKEYVMEQLGRISEENETRARLLQEEIDRRFAALRDLVDERRDNSHRALQWLQGDLDRKLDSLQVLDAQRHADLKEMMLIGQATAHAAVEAALASTNEATRKSEAAYDKRFDGVNEFRKALSDQTTTFIPRAEFDAQIKSLTERMTLNTERAAALELRLSSRLDTSTGERSGVVSSETEQRAERNLRASLISAGIAAVIAIATIISLVMYNVKR